MRKLYLLYISTLIILVFASAAVGAEPATRIITEDLTGKHVYLLDGAKPKKERLMDKAYKFPKRHPRIWRVGKWTGNVCLWACQITAALK